MKKLLVTVLMLTLTAALWAWPEAKRIEVRPGSILGWDNASGTWRPLAVIGDGKLDVNTSIGSITVDAFPVFSDGAGNPATATVDTDHRAIINIGSDTSGLLTAAENISLFSAPANYLATDTVTLVAGVSQEVGGNLPPGTPRKFIEIVAESNTEEFWINYGGAAAVGDTSSRRVYGGIYLELRGGAGSINVVASEALNLYITEGGVQ